MIGGWLGWWTPIPITDPIIVLGVFGIIYWMNKKKKGIFQGSFVYNKVLYPFALCILVIMLLSGILVLIM
jgi:hypothetical protein